eukprot:437390-Pelagomonas_calceolata.AAC.2
MICSSDPHVQRLDTRGEETHAKSQAHGIMPPKGPLTRTPQVQHDAGKETGTEMGSEVKIDNQGWDQRGKRKIRYGN